MTIKNDIFDIKVLDHVVKLNSFFSRNKKNFGPNFALTNTTEC